MQQAVADYTHIFSPTIVNDLRVGFNRYRVDYTLAGTTPNEPLAVELGVTIARLNGAANRASDAFVLPPMKEWA